MISKCLLWYLAKGVAIIATKIQILLVMYFSAMRMLSSYPHETPRIAFNV